MPPYLTWVNVTVNEGHDRFIKGKSVHHNTIPAIISTLILFIAGIVLCGQNVKNYLSPRIKSKNSKKLIH